MEINLFDFYSRILVPLSPPANVSRMLELTMAGGETTDDIGRLVMLDPELLHWVRLTVQRLGFDKRVQKVDQMVTLLGANRIRDLIIGRNIERAFVKEENSLQSKASREMMNKEKKPSNPKAEASATGEEESHEIIPAINEFQGYLKFANEAEEVAIKIRNSYPGQAFAGGVLFDYVAAFLKTCPISSLTDDRLRNPDKFLEMMTQDGLRSAVAAHEITQKISIPHQKNVFVTAFVHNIGKALLLGFDPPRFAEAFAASSGPSKKAAEKGRAKKEDPAAFVESNLAEQERFDFDHAQAASLYLGRLSFLRDIERSVDYHHQPGLLRYSDPNLYALACILQVSGALVKLYQKARETNPNVNQLDDAVLVARPEFQFLKLDSDEWSSIKSQYVLNLMKLEL